ncbi:MAG: malonate transporter [Candidatus Endobugula sp.]|jgi:malonate transporter
MLLPSFLFAIEVTFPISALILLGMYLKRLNWIDEQFSITGSKLVFKLVIPCMLFVSITQADLTGAFPGKLVTHAVIATTFIFLSLHFIAYFIELTSRRGAFVQASCRSNIAIVGIAFCINAFGEEIITTVAMYLSVIVILYNVYSVLTLLYHQDSQPSFKMVFEGVYTNPLIIAIFLGYSALFLNLTIPQLLLDTGDSISRMGLPLALLCIGASIRKQEFQSSKLLFFAVGNKLIMVPLIVTVASYFMGLRGEHLGVLFMMMAAPTAAVAYPMVRMIGGDYYLTSAVIATTTLFSVITVTIGIFFFNYIGWF